MKFQQKILIVGGVVGALMGVIAALLYLKSNETRIVAVESGELDSVGKVSPAEGIAVGMTVIGLLRQIVTLGQG